MIRLKYGSSFALLLVCALGCGSDEGDGDPAGQGGGSGNGGGGAGDMVSFAEDIHPIFLAKCAGSGCHSVANPVQPGHAAADVEDAYIAATGITSLSAPAYERILIRIASPDPATMMPPSYASMPCEGALGAPGCVTQVEFDLIQDWVEQGRPQ